MANIYEMLAEELSDYLGPTDNTSWEDIVAYLSERGFLDYDNLKEILLNDEEE